MISELCLLVQFNRSVVSDPLQPHRLQHTRPPFASGGQSFGVSPSASVLPMNMQDWFPLGWTGWISLQSKGLSRVFSNTIVQKHQFKKKKASILRHSAFFIVQLSHPYMTTAKTIALTRWTFVDHVTALLFNMLSRLDRHLDRARWPGFKFQLSLGS